jgi:vacuolar-type H+-ATPase subunit H
MADKSAIARIKQLEEEKRKILTGALSEVKTRVQQALADLKALGEDYILVPRAKTLQKQASRKGRRKSTRTIKDAPCPICKFKTKPPHDRRAHRFSNAKKRPFNGTELKEKGYTKV